MGPLTLSYIDTPKTYMSLASQPQWCRNVAAEVDGRDRYHPRFLSHHQTVYFVSPREPRTRHLITKPRPMCCLHQKVKFWTKRECMSQLGPTLLSWLALLICCGGRIRLRDVRRLLLRKVSRCWSRIECLCQGVSLQRLFILEEFGAMGRSNGVGGCFVMIDEAVKTGVSSTGRRGCQQ